MKRKQVGQVLFGSASGCDGTRDSRLCGSSRSLEENNEHMLSILKANPDAPAKALQYFGTITKLIYNQGPFGMFRPFKFCGSA